MVIEGAAPALAPAVLAGGRSVRFGRDKLVEPWPRDSGRCLIEASIDALETVTGREVVLLGASATLSARLGRRSLADAYPGIGPLGGLITGLEALGDLLVCPGDLPWIDAETLARLAVCARESRDAWVIRARAEARAHPTVAVWRRRALQILRDAASGEAFRLMDVVPRDRIAEVEVDAFRLHNANVVHDLSASRDIPRRTTEGTP